MARHGVGLLAADDFRVAPSARGRGHRAGAGAGVLGRLHGGGARSRRRPAARPLGPFRGAQAPRASPPAPPPPPLPRPPCLWALPHPPPRRTRSPPMGDDRAAPVSKTVS